MKLNLFALAFAGGIYAPWFSPWLFPGELVFPSLLIGLVGLFFRPAYIGLFLLGSFLVGMSWGIYSSNHLNQRQIPAVAEGIEARVIGTIISIPQQRSRSQRFEFQVESFSADVSEQPHRIPEKFLLSWYQFENQLKVGDRYQFWLKLRRPRGLSNFGQFDYRRWLLGQGFDGTGYVREGQYLGKSNSPRAGINQFRSDIQSGIEKQGFDNSGLISALGIGHREGVETMQWRLFQQTGVIHLMVISGLHIGFASLLGFALGGLLAKPLLALGALRSDFQVRWTVSLVFAAVYAILAGLSLPTMRALIMVSILALSRLCCLNWSAWTLVSLTLALVALLQPQAVLQDSFWLSFGAVIVLVIAFSGRAKVNFLQSLVLAQCMLFCGFGGLLLALGKPLYVHGLIANILAVPLTGFVLVPLILITLLLLPLFPEVAYWLLQLSDLLLTLLLRFLEFVGRMPFPAIDLQSIQGLDAILACLTGLLIVALPSWKMRLLLAAVLLPLTLGFRTNAPELSLTVFDVGQGTAVLVEQPDYQLLYDTGPAFSEEFNAGANILLPHLVRAGGRLNTLVVSHDDSDHSGGVAPLTGQLQIGELYTGGRETYQLNPELSPKYCASATSWKVGRVNYRFLHPSRSGRPLNSNNQSCVLLIEFGDQKLLLAGDIERDVEQQVLQNYPELADIDWLLVPHHGSKTSSSQSFVDRLNPDFAVVSAGYGNSFGHPAEVVVDRYLSVDTQLLPTAEMGSLRFVWPTNEQGVSWHYSREGMMFWWQE